MKVALHIGLLAAASLLMVGCTSTGGGFATGTYSGGGYGAGSGYSPSGYPTAALLPIVPDSGIPWPDPPWAPNVGSHDAGTVMAEAGKQATYAIPELLDERAVRIPVKAGAGLVWGLVEASGRPREYAEALENARKAVQNAEPMQAWFEPYGIDNRQAVGARVNRYHTGVEITRYVWAGSWVPETVSTGTGGPPPVGYGNPPPPDPRDAYQMGYPQSPYGGTPASAGTTPPGFRYPR